MLGAESGFLSHSIWLTWELDVHLGDWEGGRCDAAEKQSKQARAYVQGHVVVT